jgi:hypothetical protein
MTKPPPPPEQPRRAHLVQQDIRIEREAPDDDPASRVVASVHCVHKNCRVEVEDCAGCAHFARIEPHEAGYVLLCCAQDEAQARAESPGDDAAGKQRDE